MKTTEAIKFPSLRDIADLDMFSRPFFQPDDEFVKWLIGYANGRVICDVGAGSGWLCGLIIKNGGKAFGIEPMWTPERHQFWHRYGLFFNVLPQHAEKSMVMTFPPEKTLLVFARPSHNGFVYNVLDTRPQGMEALYIGRPENFELDLPYGYFDKAKKLKPKGKSQDQEIVLSL